MILLNIVAIFAHPDDLTFYSAGTVARWADEGHSVIALCCTKGEVGTLRFDLTKEQVAEKREKELRAANEFLGVKETILLDYPDAGFIAIAVGKNVNLKASEAFFVQKILTGHFDNFQQLMSEMLGNPPEPPKIY